jgi:hypothetical protein
MTLSRKFRSKKQILATKKKGKNTPRVAHLLLEEALHGWENPRRNYRQTWGEALHDREDSHRIHHQTWGETTWEETTWEETAEGRELLGEVRADLLYSASHTRRLLVRRHRTSDRRRLSGV